MSSDTITISAEVNLSDITDSVTFSEMMEAYSMSMDDVLAELDTDEVLAWAAEQPEVSSPSAVSSFLDNDDFRAEVIDQFKANDAWGRQVKLAQLQLPQIITLHSCLLFQHLEVGALMAVILGDRVRYRNCAEGAGDVVAEFHCADAGLALKILQALAAAS